MPGDMAATVEPRSLAPRLDFLELAKLLRRRVAGQPLPHSFIHEVSVYSAAPEDLIRGPDLAAPEDLIRGRDPAPGTHGKEAWYFCSAVNFHRRAERRNRQVGGGGHTFWHPEGDTNPIRGPDGKSVGAYWRTLSYVHKVRNQPGTAAKRFKNVRLGWCMIEVGLGKQDAPAAAGQRWEICKVYRSPSPPSTEDPAETSTAAAGQHESTVQEVAGGGTPCPLAPPPASCASKQETLAIVNKSKPNAAAAVVMKFDGSSIASAKQMKEMANLVLSSPAVAGVVLSAIGNFTVDILFAAVMAREARENHEVRLSFTKEWHLSTIDELGLDRSIVSGSLDELEQHLQNVSRTKELTPIIRDYLVSFGERTSTIMFYEYLNKLGKGTVQEWELRTVTTFGSGGSDMTAAILGRELGSKEIQVWKDQNSIFTCDPDVYANAIPIPCLTFDEAAELGSFSAKSMQVAKEGGIEVIVKNPYNPQADGTVITKTRDMSKCTLTSIVLKSNITMLDIEGTCISMLDQKAFVEKAISVFEVLKYWSIDVEWAANGQGKMLFTLLVVPSRYFCLALFQQALDNAVQELKKIATVDRLEGKSVISLVGNPQMLTSILEKARSVLQSNHVAVEKVSQELSKIKVSLVVDKCEATRSVKLLHSAFFELNDDSSDDSPATVSSSWVARSGDKRKADDSLLLELSEQAHFSQLCTGGECVKPTFKIGSAHRTLETSSTSSRDRTRSMACEDTRWVVSYASNLHAPKTLTFRDGALFFHQETLRLVLCDDDEFPVETRFLYEGETVDEGGWIQFPCHIVRVSQRVVHERDCDTRERNAGRHGTPTRLDLEMY